MDCKECKKRLDILQKDRWNVQQQWELIRKYVVPYRGQFFQDSQEESAVQWRENRDVYDSTAINANNILASSLHGAITNPSHQWFEFRFRNEQLSNNREAAQWLRDRSIQCFEVLRDSNFNLQANEGYIDFTSFGTSFVSREVLEKESSFEDLLFKSVPVEEGYFEQDYRGRICVFYRKMRWTAKQIYSKFVKPGKEAPKIPQKVKDAYEAGRVDQKFTIVFCVYKREGDHNIIQVLSAENRPYGYKYFLYDNAEQIGEEGGYYNMPVLVMRWRNTADSMWGNSPAMVALPDILTLNQLVELILNSLEKVVDPAIVTTERGLLSSLNLGAAGVNVVRKMDELAPFESRARFDVAELNREKLQQSIRQIFYIDQLELKDSPAMTATEVSVRYDLMQRLLGPTLGRLQSDFLDPLVSSVFTDLMRYNEFPDAPSIIGDFDPSINIEYTGPMARAQRADQAQQLTSFLAAASELGKMNPDSIEKVDFDRAMELLASYHGADPMVLKSDTEVKRNRRQRQQAEQRQLDADAAKTEAQAGEIEGRAQSSMTLQ